MKGCSFFYISWASFLVHQNSDQVGAVALAMITGCFSADTQHLGRKEKQRSRPLSKQRGTFSTAELFQELFCFTSGRVTSVGMACELRLCVVCLLRYLIMSARPFITISAKRQLCREFEMQTSPFPDSVPDHALLRNPLHGILIPHREGKKSSTWDCITARATQFCPLSSFFFILLLFTRHWKTKWGGGGRKANDSFMAPVTQAIRFLWSMNLKTV